MEYTLICCVCGKKFSSPTLSRKFCSALCKRAGQAPDVPLLKDGKTYKRKCAVCGIEFESSCTSAQYCAYCRSRPYTDEAKAIVDEYKKKYPAWMRQKNHDVPRGKTCKRCFKIFVSDVPGRICPDCRRTEEIKKAKAEREPWDPTLETYGAYQRRTNPPSMYADGRHLDKLLGIKK